MKPVLPVASGRLRPATLDDAGRVLSLLRTPDVRRFLCDDRVLARSDVKAMLADSIRLDAEGLGLWIIEADPNGFAGIMGLAPVSPQASVSPDMIGGIEPTIAIDPEHEGKGLAFDAMTAVIDYARSRLRLQRLVAAVDEPNTRSNRLMKRAGFETMGPARGPVHDLLLYELAFDDASDGQ